jgi:hypothetical protein
MLTALAPEFIRVGGQHGIGQVTGRSWHDVILGFGQQALDSPTRSGAGNLPTVTELLKKLESEHQQILGGLAREMAAMERASDPIRPILDDICELRLLANELSLLSPEKRAGLRNRLGDLLDGMQRQRERLGFCGLPPIRALNEADRKAWEWDINRALDDLLARAGELLACADRVPPPPSPEHCRTDPERIRQEHDVRTAACQESQAMSDRLMTVFNRVWQLAQRIDLQAATPLPTDTLSVARTEAGDLADMPDLPTLDDILTQQRAEKDRFAELERLEEEARLRRLELLKPFLDLHHCTQDSLPPESDFFAEFAHRLTTLATHLSGRRELGWLLERVGNVPDEEGENERHARLFVARLLTMASGGQEQEVAQALRALLEARAPCLGRVNEWLRWELQRIMSRYYRENDAVDGIDWPVLLPFQDEPTSAAMLLLACDRVTEQLEQRRELCGGIISTNLFKQFWRQVVALACRLRKSPPAAPGPLWRVDDVIQEAARVRDWVRQNSVQPSAVTTIGPVSREETGSEAEGAPLLSTGQDHPVQAVPAITAKRGKGINQKMKEWLEKDATRIDWSLDDWADALDCSRSTVHGTETWNVILNTRAMIAAERLGRKGCRKIDRRRIRKKQLKDE